jgi:hypothetical protein
MKMKKPLLIAIALLGALQLASAADITGKVTLKGTPPANPQLPFDPKCGELHKEPVHMPLYAVAPDGGLAGVFVYIKDGLSGKTFPVPAEPVELDQKGCEYKPYVLGIQAKQKLLVKTSDPLLHNVHLMPKGSVKEFNRAQVAGQKPFEFVFDEPAMFLNFKCDVHNWMNAYVSVVDHPFFAVTGKDGTFTLKNVPSGKYTVEAVHRKTHPNGKGIPQEVTVGADGAKVDFVVELKK